MKNKFDSATLKLNYYNIDNIYIFELVNIC